MGANIRGGEGLVKPWVQRCANAIQDTIGVTSFGTYPGHEPDLTLACDVFVPVFSVEPGTSITEYLLPHFEEFGIWYIIFRQRIWNPEISASWRAMEDRGSPTQNHFDHVHISFYATDPGPTPDPLPGKVTDMLFRYVYDGADYVFDGPSALFFQCNDTRQITEVLDKLKVPALGVVSKTTHDRYAALAKAAGYSG